MTDIMANASHWADVLERWVDQRPDARAAAFLSDGEEVDACTYAELHRDALRIAGRLPEPAGRAILIYRPGLDFVRALIGCWYGGWTPLPVYAPGLTGLENWLKRLQALAVDGKVTAVLSTAAMRRQVELAVRLAEASGLTWLTTDGDGGPPPLESPRRRRDVPALLQYTSGSTGRPKGVVLTHENLLANQRTILGCFGQHEMGVSWLPVYHDMGLIGMVLQPLYAGYPTVLMAPLDFIKRPVRWLQALTRYRGTVSAAPNFAYQLCVTAVSDEERQGVDLSSLRTAIMGAEPVRAETLDRFAERFAPCGFRREAIHPSYGLAEASLLVAGKRIGPAAAIGEFDRAGIAANEVGPPRASGHGAIRLVSNGPPAPGVEIAIVDPDSGAPRPEGAIGEIWVASGSVAAGYFDKEELSEQTFRARLTGSDTRFLRTGDHGFLSGGELYVTGRIKETIILRGRNYYPHDIEDAVIAAHPQLRQSGVVAAGWEIDGEERLVVICEMTRKTSAALQDEEQARPLRASIARAVYDQTELLPEAVLLVERGMLSRTTSGKLQRLRAAKLLADRIEEAYRSGVPALEPRPETGPSAGAAASGSWQAEIEQRLVRLLAQALRLPVERIDPRRPLREYGLTSVKAVELVREMEAAVGRPLSPTLAFDYPTVEALARHLRGQTSDRAVARSGQAGPLAIVGIGCRLPGGVDSARRLWALVRSGGSGIVEMTADRRPRGGYGELPPAIEERLTTRRGGFLEQVDQFDPEFFGIAGREAARMDPQQRLLLECTWEAIEDAGIDPRRLEGSRTGVFVGACNFDYTTLYRSSIERVDAHAATGCSPSIIANRVSYVLGLQGPSCTIDTACSSSLAAVHLARRSLQSGDCDLALVGGVNLILGAEGTLSLSQAGMLSPDGRCHTFSERANGYARGEGCAMIVLRELSAARSLGERVYAVLRGSAMNSDGRSNGLTAPNGRAQVAVLREALADAGIEASRVEYVEAHGTGTPLGDPIEVEGIGEVYGSPDRLLYIGSLKANVGHLEAAAGVGGLLKLAMALHEGEIPPHPMEGGVNPHLRLEAANIRLPSEPLGWAGPRVGAVSSFGFGGTNVHVVMEQAPASRPRIDADARRPESGTVHTLCLSARSARGLVALAEEMSSRLDAASEEELFDLCATAREGRSVKDARLFAVGRGARELKADLARAAARVAADRAPPPPVARVALLFSGQGSQAVGAGRALYEREPVFADAIDRCHAVAQRAGLADLRALLFSADAETLARTEWSQPVLFAVEWAMYRLLSSYRVEPTAVAGHSVGQYVAAAAAGVMSADDAMELVVHRGRLMAELTPPGAMASVSLDEASARALVEPVADRVAVAAINGPGQTVLSGEREALAAVLTQAEIRHKMLPVTRGFHSPLMDAAIAPLRERARTVAYAEPRMPLVANATGEVWSSAPTADDWARHLREPVRFGASIETLFRLGCNVFVELGPRPVLLPLVPGAGAADCARIPLVRGRRSEEEEFAGALGELFAAGVSWRHPRPHAVVDLPPSSYERRSLWFEPERPSESSLRDRGRGALLDRLIAGRAEEVAEMLARVEQLDDAEANRLAEEFRS